MKDFLDSFNSWIKEKNNGPFYVVFLLSYIGWNWKTIYVLFFENENYLRGATKLEYASWHSNVMDRLDTNVFLFGIPVFDNPLVQAIVDFGSLFLVPVILTYLAVTWLPYLHNWAHKKHLKFTFGRKLEFDRQNTSYQQEKTEILNNVKAESKRQTKVLEELVEESEKQKRVEALLPDSAGIWEDRWRKEFETFQKSPLYHEFRKVYELIYTHGGQVEGDYGRINIDAKSLAYAHANDLVTYKDDSTNIVQLTEKGRYFTKLYLEDPVSDIPF